MKNFTHTTKTILFASLIASMILPLGMENISAMQEQDAKNPRDKTAERMQEKKDRQVTGIVTTHDWWRYYHTPVDQIIDHMDISPVLN